MVLRALCLAILVIATVPAARAAEVVPVSAAPLSELLIDNELRAPATVISANQAVVTSQVAAIVEQVLRDVGDDVDKGDLLIRLDDDNARLALAQAVAVLAGIEAQIAEAQSKLANARNLLEKNFISDEELIAREAALAVLEANRNAQQVAVNLAELELERTRIRSPFAAAIVERQAQVGSYAQPGTPLITLVQTDRREIDVEVDPRYAADVPNASNPRFTSRGIEWPVQLERVSSVIDVSSRLLRARFTFVDEAAPIGTSGQLVWKASTGLVPVELIVERNEVLGVFVVSSTTASFVPIAGAQEGRPAKVDLPPDALVVFRGHTRLQDGDPIQVTSR